MKILVRFMDLPAISEYVGSKMKPQGELVDKEKKKTPPFFLIWSCPTCRKVIQYDGKRTKDCPDCGKREGELEGIGSIGGSLARKGMA